MMEKVRNRSGAVNMKKGTARFGCAQRGGKGPKAQQQQGPIKKNISIKIEKEEREQTQRKQRRKGKKVAARHLEKTQRRINERRPTSFKRFITFWKEKNSSKWEKRKGTRKQNE